MSFKGYKYKFNLKIKEDNVEENVSKMTCHNIMLTLYVSNLGDKHDVNYRVEESVRLWLEQFQGKALRDFVVVKDKEEKIKQLGDFLFDLLAELVESVDFTLIRLNIEETPAVCYSVSKYLLDSSVNRIRSMPENSKTIYHLSEDKKKEVVTEETTKESEGVFEEEVAVTLEQEENRKKLKKEKNKNNSVFGKAIYILLAMTIFTGLAAITLYYLRKSGVYPQGSDTFCHLYRSDLILQNIKSGNWYPLYDESWYNGVEIMRYWGPLPLYFIAGIEWIVGSGILDAYLAFIGVLIIVGGLGWLLFGLKYKKVPLSVFIGCIWFFYPENIRVVIMEGNLPRGVIHMLLPFFLYFLWRFLEDKDKKSIIGLTLMSAFITLCHMGMVLMLIGVVGIFLILHGSKNHSVKWELYSFCGCVIGILLVGIWAIPSLIGGAASSGSSTNQVMVNFFSNGFTSLNPFLRWQGDILTFYFGLATFILCVLGICCGNKKVKSGFLVGMILFLCTTKSVCQVFVKLPFSQFLWMIRFIPVALGFVMLSFIMWKELKKGVIVLIAICILADCVSSYKYIYNPEVPVIKDVEKDLYNRAESSLMNKAKDITKQRMVLMDLSRYGAFAPYYIAGVNKKVNFTFGAGWEGAHTAENIVRLNSSVEGGWYYYLFDRALELGNDTVLIVNDNLKNKRRDISKVTRAAKAVGYELVEKTASNMLFHREVGGTFGIKTEYPYIAIGESAASIAKIYPLFCEGDETNIEKYSFETLVKYKKIYLSGFDYDNKKSCEDLLLKLANAGVEIYVDMNNVKEDSKSHEKSLFDVKVHSIQFELNYPVFEYHNLEYSMLDFPENLQMFNTVYLEGLKKTEGISRMDGKDLPYYGSSIHDNIRFLGLNMIYYLESTKDIQMQQLLNSIFGMEETSVPKRELVPVIIEYEDNRITIRSNQDDVNVALANLDIFHSENVYEEKQNLIYVNSGITVLEIKYPHLWKGIIVSAIGIILMVFLTITIFKAEAKEDET